MALIRLAEPGDVLRIVDMIEDLRAAVEGPIAVDRPWTAMTVAGLIADPAGVVFVSDGGFIAGALRATVINPEPIACEQGWFARDRSGLALLRTCEQWAVARGARLIQLSTGATGPDLARLGYRLAEKAWIKT